MKVCDSKSGSKYIRIALVLVFVLLTGLILLSIREVFKTKDTPIDDTSTVVDTVQEELNEDTEEEYINPDYEEDYYNDPAIDEVRYYNNVIIPRYNEAYITDADIYCMCRYIRFTSSEFVDLPEDFDMANAIAESRGSNLYVYYNDISGYRENVEMEIDSEDSSIYYIKFSNNQNDDIAWYIFRLTQIEDTKYSIDCEKVEYDTIASKLTALDNEISFLTDDRSYCEWFIEDRKEVMGCDEIYYEGISEPLTVDTLMQIQGYTD